MNAEQLKAQGYVEISKGNWQKPKFLPPVAGEPETIHVPVDRERDLHDQIEAELKRRRYYYVHSRTDKRTTQNLGVPDFIIAARATNSMHDNGTTYWIEVKKRGGKLTPEQNVTKHVLTALGHRYKTVFSFEEFLEFVK